MNIAKISNFNLAGYAMVNLTVIIGYVNASEKKRLPKL